ncbi:hypothetical protein RHMOL_Rhmol08G0085400 [Rhododendron molle]|uniref:Uncharacterized protein n=1 Tax=Rhododendron molle TaxID=49168 RepID=A0ACC0MMP2_RHOML|nr:hypothetical protein RHMOL_Rhmol08G0085400 [Rhododendron molle]
MSSHNSGFFFFMANSHVQDAPLEVDSFLQPRAEEYLKIDVDSTEYHVKDLAKQKKKKRTRKWIYRSCGYKRLWLNRINHLYRVSKHGNCGKENQVSNRVERLGISLGKEPRTSKGGITSSLGIGDSVECVAASSSDLVHTEKKLFGLCKYSPAVNDVSIDKPSAQFAVKRHSFGKRVRKRKVKPLCNEGKHYEKKAMERSVCERNLVKATLVNSESGRKYPACDLVATKHSSLALLNMEDNFLEVQCVRIERGPVACLRKKLLILDVNGLLADIVHPPPKECKADTNILRRAIFKRPFCNDFLKFCFERFDIGIWSSRTKKIIDRVVDYLLGDMKNKLLFCWDLSHCTGTGFKTLENKHKELVFKELRKLWEKHDPNLPWGKGYYNASNTLLLDDSPYKAILNPKHTAIFPYSYDFKDSCDNSLGPEGDIQVYLRDLAAAGDAQKYVENHPFGQRGIDETSMSWEYYHRVISGHSTR